MTTKQEKATRLDNARKVLEGILKPGDTVFTSVTHVARSGMSRSIRAFVMINNEPVDISYYTGVVCDFKMDEKNGGCKIDGCGMDMGFALVYDLSRVMFRDNFECIGNSDEYAKRCPSNDHVNSGPERNNYAPHKHSDSGYALRQRWM